jgi:hypothetical protein
VRASEAIDYVSRRVPELTGSRQHPRVAGTFDARLALATSVLPPAPTRGVTLDVSGPAGSQVYLDNVFRGAIRPAGTLRVESLAPGPHPFSADFLNGPSLHGFVTLSELPARVSIAPPAQPATGPVAEAATAAALEETGQACVSDYVQSTATGLKRAMLARSLEAFERLQSLRPGDPSIETRKLFCRGRLLIAESRFLEAVTSLEASEGDPALPAPTIPGRRARVRPYEGIAGRRATASSPSGLCRRSDQLSNWSLTDSLARLCRIGKGRCLQSDRS